MRRLFAGLAVLMLGAGAVAGLPAAAVAAATESATLTCGTATYPVAGFGRGQVLHVVDSERMFVVAYARLDPQGTVVFDNPGQDLRADSMSCTTTSPSGQDYIFRGFFTPR